jgi:hypothetical protein
MQCGFARLFVIILTFICTDKHPPCRLGKSLKMSLYFEKDAVLFSLPPELASELGKPLGLGAVLNTIETNRVQLQLMCIREEGSKEFYLDSRVPPLVIQTDDIIRVGRDSHLIAVHNALQIETGRVFSSIREFLGLK